MQRAITLGDILLVSLPLQHPRGHEQEGQRPILVVGQLERIGRPRYGMVLGVPLTTQIQHWATRSPKLYPQLKPGSAGLSKQSVILLDQMRSIDVKRIIGYIGRLTDDELQPICESVQDVVRF